MGCLRLTVDEQAWTLPMSASTRVGRHWSCDLPLPVAAAPLYWIEVRWRTDHWSWRPLAATDRTRGSGAIEAGEWRSWATGEGRIRLDGCGCAVDVVLLDDDPPGLVVEHLHTRRRWSGSDVDERVELWPDGRTWPLGADPGRDPPLKDGDVFLHDGHAYRVHVPFDHLDTDKLPIDLSDEAVSLDIDLGTLSAVFAVGKHEAVAGGECVRVLGVYAHARLQDEEAGGGGWLPALEAHSQWIGLGGRAESPVDRLAWERGKLRTRLAGQGVGGLESLFETRRVGGATEVRLRLAPNQVTLDP